MSQIDEVFKDKLSHQGIEYHDAYWNDMEKLLDKKQKKKFILFFCLMTALVLTILVGFVQFLSDTKMYSNGVSAVSEKNKVRSQKEDYETETLSATPSYNSPTVANFSKLQKTNELPSNNTLSKQTTHPIANMASSIQKEKQTTSSKHIVQPEPTNIMGSGIEPVNFQISDDKLDFSQCVKLKKLRTDFELELNPCSQPYLEKKIGKPDFEKNKDSMKTKAKWQYFIAPGYEYDLYKTDANQTGLKAYERKLNTSGYNLNFIAIKNNWGFKTGIGLLQLSELTNYVSIKSNYRLDTSYKMVDANFEQTPAGTRIALIKRQIDTSLTYSQSINNPDSKFELTYFKIPILASYALEFNRIDIFINAGINSSFLLQKRGYYTTFSDNSFSVKNVKSGNDFNKVLFQTYTAIGIRYQLVNSLNIYAAYGLSMSLNSITKSYSKKPNLNLYTLGLEIKL